MLRREDDRAQVFKITKQMTTRNQDKCDKGVRNDGYDLAISDHRKHLAWKEHHHRLLNEEFEWNKDNLSVNNPIIRPHP